MENIVRYSSLKSVVTCILLLLLCASMSCKKENPYEIKNPESVVWNPVTSSYLISITGTGKILSMKDKSKFEVFNDTKLVAPKGMTILNNVLYVTDLTQVVGYTLSKGKEVFRLALPGAVFLNDITAAGDSLLYISDMKGNSLIKLNPQTRQTKHYKSVLLKNPNGLFYANRDTKQLLYIVSFRTGAPVLTFDPVTAEFVPVPKVKVSLADGIARDMEGNWLISSWQDNAIHKFNPDWSAPTLLPDKVVTPADIYFNPVFNELCIPQFNTSQISFVMPIMEKETKK